MRLISDDSRVIDNYMADLEALAKPNTATAHGRKDLT
jgi:hypothetical protein